MTNVSVRVKHTTSLQTTELATLTQLLEAP